MTTAPFARNHLLRDASLAAVYAAMREDNSIHIFGEGAHVKAHYDAPRIEADFSDRVHTLPISEDGNTNFAVGTSLLGVKPIVDIISADFLYRAFDSICNTAAKVDFCHGPDRERSTIVIRAEFLIGGPTTGQRPEALFAHIPGLRVVCPSTPRDAFGLMRDALKGPGVTLYFEDRMIADDGEWTEPDMLYEGWPAPGDLATRLLGTPGTLILTYGVMRQAVERVLRRWTRLGYKLPVSVYDLPTLYPLNYTQILEALAPPAHTLLVVEPDVVSGGIGAEIVARVAQALPHIRVKRLGAPHATIPAASALHAAMLPSDDDILCAIWEDAPTRPGGARPLEVRL